MHNCDQAWWHKLCAREMLKYFGKKDIFFWISFRIIKNWKIWSIRKRWNFYWQDFTRWKCCWTNYNCDCWMQIRYCKVLFDGLCPYLAAACCTRRGLRPFLTWWWKIWLWSQQEWFRYLCGSLGFPCHYNSHWVRQLFGYQTKRILKEIWRRNYWDEWFLHVFRKAAKK